MFIFFSQLLGKNVIDASERNLGRLYDLVAQLIEPYPKVTAVVITMKGRRGPFATIPWEMVANLSGQKIKLNLAQPVRLGKQLGEKEMRLREELLDKQVLDVQGRKVVRVNDLHLLMVNGEVRLVHADVGLRGLLRRMGWEKAVENIVRLFRPRSRWLSTPQFVSWKYLQPLSEGATHEGLKLNVSQQQLAEVHPADMAEILEELDRHQRAVLFRALEKEVAAEALSETEPKVGKTLLEMVSEEQAADILEEMAPDDAADLLSHLPARQAREFLKKMEPEQADEVSQLLAHKEDTAGGLMTPEYATLSPGTSVAEALTALRELALEVETIYYIYVVEDEDKLVGVLTLKDLLLSEPSALLSKLMVTDLITVHPDEDALEVAKVLEKYDLLSVPVVDQDNCLKGIVTVDDVLTHLLEQ